MSDLFQRPLIDDGAARDESRWWAASGRKDWCSPDEELALVRAMGPIGLDPCSNPASRVAAVVECMLERGENGLARSWRGVGLTFANPPYGRGEIEQFTAKAARDFGALPRDPLGDDACILLIPANTETIWYHRDCLRGDATCLRKGRIGFRLPDGTVRDESTVANLWVYFGDRPERFIEVFGPTGDARLTLMGMQRLRQRQGDTNAR